LLQSAGPVSAKAAPDLIVDSITVSPTNPAIGQATDINVTIKNQGDAATNFVRVYLYVDPTDEPPISTTAVTKPYVYGLSFGSGATFSFGQLGQTFATSGIHKVYVWVDPKNEVAESNETNNLAGPIGIPVGSVGDSFEPDNDCTQAKDIATDGTQQTHNLSPLGDIDWIKFSGASGQTYHIKTFADGADADLEIGLFSACPGTPSFGTGADISFIAPASGTYYVKMKHVKDTYGPNTTYRVQVTTESVCTGFYEPNDTCGSANDLAVNGVPQTHNFCRPGDVDWVKFPTAAGATYIITAANTGPQADVQLSLYDACNANFSANISTSLIFTAPAAGFVYLRADNSPTTTAGADTAYTLQVAQTNLGCAQDAYESDNTPATASTAVVNTPQTKHNICPVGDVDWVKFQAVQGTTYRIETYNLGKHADPVMCLYDTSGTTQLVCDDDSGPGKGARLMWQAPATGSFYLKIRDFDPLAAGPETSYDLIISTKRCDGDDFEDDNTRATAKPITVGAPAQSHTMCSADGSPDEDWVSFTASANSPYYIQADSVGPNADPVLELYDPNGAKITSDDDYDTSTSARISVTPTVAGTYYIRARNFNPTRFGAGTEYALKVVAGLAPPPPPQKIVPPDGNQPPPTITGTQTLILVNLDRFKSVYGADQANSLSTQLNALALHPQVHGDVVRLENTPEVATAYTDWLADSTNPDKANLTAAAIRRVVLNYLASHNGVQYIVLVGGDDMLPMRRIIDNTPRKDNLERDYLDVSATTPIGAAIHANNYLTDDYYGTRTPTPLENRELYIPDLSVGRLIETPTDINASITSFLVSPSKVAGKVLVTGYDFVDDAGDAICKTWGQDLAGTGSTNCTLVGQTWTLDSYKTLQLSTQFDVESINGHANHYAEGAPGAGNSIKAQDIMAASANFVGDLIYTMGCHSGLNVPANEPNNPLDLSEAFVRKGANYVGNTGFGWGLRGAIGLSELMMKLYTDELARDTSAYMGKALIHAKQRYYDQAQKFDGYDEKVMEELVFYGLPMYTLQTGASLGNLDNPFPSVDLNSPAPSGNFGTEVISTSVALSLKHELTASTGSGGSGGSAYYVDGSGSATANTPVQPLFYGSLGGSETAKSARSVVFLGGQYAIVNNFNPIVSTPYNEYVTDPNTAALDKTGAWYPDRIVDIRSAGSAANVVAQLGQFHAQNGEQHVFSTLNADVYYSTADDKTPPVISVVDALFDPQRNVVLVKVGATDDSGIRRVIVSYDQPGGNKGEWKSVQLTYDPRSQKWTGTFPGNSATHYFAQVVDGAGNVAIATNKATYYTPAASKDITIETKIFLPFLRR